MSKKKFGKPAVPTSSRSRVLKPFTKFRNAKEKKEKEAKGTQKKRVKKLPKPSSAGPLRRSRRLVEALNPKSEDQSKSENARILQGIELLYKKKPRKKLKNWTPAK